MVVTYYRVRSRIWMEIHCTDKTNDTGVEDERVADDFMIQNSKAKVLLKKYHFLLHWCTVSEP